MWTLERRVATACALTLCLLAAVAALGATGFYPQKKPGQPDEGKTVFLVAKPDLKDPFFKESVVLMLPSSLVQGGGLVVGVIVNRPAKIALSSIFPDDKALKDKSLTAYFGGPVDPHTPGVVFRSKKSEKDALLLFGDVYVTFDPAVIKGLLEKAEKTPDLRLFLGRSQWAPEQLQEEMLRGAWFKVDAETGLIFSTSPEYLWRTLSNRAAPSSIARASIGTARGRPTLVEPGS